MDGKLSAKQKMRLHAELIRQHYNACPACSSAEPCKAGLALWDAAAVKQIEVIRGCLSWENKHMVGPRRAERLLDRMIRATQLVTKEGRP